MKILVVTDLYPIKDNEKYTPRTIYDFVQGWHELGHEIHIIKPNFILNSFIRKKPFYKSGIYNDILNLNYWFPFWGNIEHKINKYFKLKKEYDLVIAHMPSGLIFANKLGIPFVAGVHISDLEILTNPIYSIYFKNELEKAYKNATKIACRSYVLQKKFLELYPQYKDKTFVAYSGIDEKYIIQRHWTENKTIKVLTCANLKKRKNIDEVVYACNRMKNVQLEVIGTGEELNYLEDIAYKNIHFSGRLPNFEVLRRMQKADIFILPSQNETFGMVYLEAMASGCITVGLENDGIDGIIKDGENGYLCNLDNIKETIQTIIASNNQNEILANSYNTIKNYTKINACKNYLRNAV